MRRRIINFLKTHPICVKTVWSILGVFIRIFGVFIKPQQHTMIFTSFGGRHFGDSPRAIYEEICRRKTFLEWRLIWAFVNPEKESIPRGEKIKIDTCAFFIALLQSKVWISNSGMTRGIGFKRNGVTRVETWHGTPIKKIGGEENSNTIGGKKKTRVPSKDIIRCAQSDYDKEIFKRIFNAPDESFLLCDLPRNDCILQYTEAEVAEIRKNLNIPEDKQVLLYTPTYREYLINEHREIYIAPPINMKKWKERLGDRYVLLIRAHYAVDAAWGVKDDDFVRNVTKYPELNDLYAIADEMISDYSSTFIDYSLLGRPMYCYAYDLDEYKEKRGLYIDLEKELPCPVDRDEDTLLDHILNDNKEEYIQKTKEFRDKYAPFAGHASQRVVDEIEKHVFNTKG